MQSPSPEPQAEPRPEIAALARQVHAATAQRQPLWLHAGRSKDFYGHAAPATAQALDLCAVPGLNRLVSHDPSELVVTAGAAMPLAALEAQLAQHGQVLPFEPPHFGGGATVGGMVAAGLSGPARVAAGSVRDHVLGVQMINGHGQVLRFGGQVIKNVAGYDLSRVLAGSMGILGVMTEITLKVMPQAPAEATLVWPLAQAPALLQLQRWLGQPLPINASCWVRDETDGGRELLFVRLRGARAAVDSATQRMLDDLGNTCPGTVMDNAVAQPDWARCRDLQLPFFTQPPAPGLALWRLSLPATTPVLDDLPWPQFVEWHGAQRWLWAPVSAAAQLRTLAERQGGHATLFIANNGVNTAETADLSHFSALSAPVLAIHRRLKAEFDPAGIFNPGRLVRGL